jgi:prolyl oligopeptidase
MDEDTKMSSLVAAFVVVAATGLVALSNTRADDPMTPPSTPKKPVVDTYHGVQVIDDYRWLEDTNDSAVREWIQGQNRVTRTHLDQSPSLKFLRARLKELMADPQPRYSELHWRGDLLFGLKEQPPAEQPALITLKSANDPQTAQVLLDPSKLDSTGKTTIDFYEPSRDGKLVAVSLSQGGSEDGTLYVYEVATGKKRDDVIPRVNYPTAGGCVSWSSDGKGFYYARLPRAGQRPKEDLNFYQQVFYHTLGTPADADTYVIGKEFPRIAEVFLDSSSDGRYLLATVQNGDSGEFEHHLLGPNRGWTRLTTYADQINAVAFGDGDDRHLYLVSYKAAPKGRILRMPLADPQLSKAVTVVPESDVAIVGLRWQGTRMVASHIPTAKGLYVLDSTGGPSQVRYFPRDGGQATTLPLPPVCDMREMVHLADERVLLNIVTYTAPAAWFTYQPGDKQLHPTALRRKPPASFDDIQVDRVFATSHDGTKVPMTVMYPRGIKLDGSAPALLYGYGGYGISMTPSFDPTRRIWFDHGGIYAIANIRGGSEYGQAWHRAAMRTGRRLAYDDFYACEKFLVDEHYTSPARLAIEGASNGGLLMGAELTQHPELVRAVVSHVGIYDMLRSELSANGTFNIPEFGTVKQPAEFKALYAYSPLHHVQDHTNYPAVLLLTGVNDGRVDPANSYKMAARLQAATTGPHPILLRVTFESGHGMGASLSEEIDEKADVYAFLFEQLGIDEQAEK